MGDASLASLEMRSWILATGLALAAAAPAHAASLPATFAAPSKTEGLAATADVATTDLDGDGRPDFVVADAGTITALDKPYAAGGTVKALALGDLNADGRPDIVSANGTTLSALLAKADKTFAAAAATPILPQEQALDVAIGQLTNDTKPDLVIATGKDDVMVFPGDGSGGFGVPVYVPVAAAANRVALADVNHDGRTDIAVATPTGVKELLGSAAGFVQQAPVYGVAATSLALADLNGDDQPDLITGSPKLVSVSYGRAAGSFDDAITYDTESDAHELAVADVNGDGHRDVVVTRTAGGLELLAGSGNGELEDAAALDGAGTAAVAIADADGDGRPDLASVGDGFELRRNTTSRSTASAPAASDHRALTIAVNADGTAQPKVRLYVKAPGAAGFTLAAERPAAPFTYTADSDGAYAFYTTLVDADGNEEVAPATPDTVTAVKLTRTITAELGSFGGQRVGTVSAPVETRLTNTGEATLMPRPQLTGADFALSGDECTGTTLKPGDSCVIRVSFTPTAAGTRSARVSYDGGGLDLSGEGVAPPVVLPAPKPPVIVPAPPQKVAGKLVATYRKGKLTRLILTGVTKGATVKATRGKATFAKRNAPATVSLMRLIKAKGAKIVVTVSKRGLTSVTHTLTVKTKKISSR